MSHVGQLLIRVTSDDGTTISVFVDIPAGTSPANAAALISSALTAEGIRNTVNGNTITVWGHGSSEVEDVNVQVTQADDPIFGRDNPAIKPPDVKGHNGATGSGSVNLPGNPPPNM
jgi:hypothetical protein